MKTKHKIALLLAAIAFALMPVLLFGQTNEASGDNITAADESIRAVVEKFSYWKLLIVPITMILVQGVKKFVAFVPDKYLPWCGPIIGGLLDLVATKFGFWTGDGAAGAMMGGLATWAHQAVKQTAETDPGKTNENAG